MRLSIGSVLPPPSRPLELGNEGSILAHGIGHLVIHFDESTTLRHPSFHPSGAFPFSEHIQAKTYHFMLLVEG